MGVTWLIIKNFAIDRNVSIQYVDMDNCYYLKVYDGIYTLEYNLFKDEGSDQIDFETNFKSLGNIKLNILDTDGTPIVKTKVLPQGLVSVGNTSSSPLSANAIYLGAFEEVVDYAGLTLSIFSDKSSAVSGLKMQWSHDGINVDKEEGTDITGGAGRAFNISRRARYFRLKYINGALDQTQFRVGVVYGYNDPGTITRPIGDPISDSNFAQLSRSVLAGKQDNGTFSNIGLSNSGNMKISVAESITLPVKETSTGTWSNGTETIVGATAVQIQATNSTRKTLIVQNTGLANIRVGIAGVTSTTGVRLVAGGTIIFQMPNVEINAIFAIREGTISSIVLAQETT